MLWLRPKHYFIFGISLFQMKAVLPVPVLPGFSAGSGGGRLNALMPQYFFIGLWDE
jgi:hypothetical protein